MRSSEVERRVFCLARCGAFDAASGVGFVALVLVALATAAHYGISNDEGVQQRYGELIIAYYASGLTDQSVFHFENLLYYGGLFDIVAVLVRHIVPADPYAIRHILCALIGIGGIGATWATARLVAGPRAGAIAGLALSVCGPWYGAMFNHTKDIPLAAAMMGATYFLIRAARSFPQPAWSDVLGFGLSTGCALGMRVHGLLLVFYAGCTILIFLPRSTSGHIHDRALLAASTALRLAPALLLAYLVMILTWPWAALAPLNPLRALVVFDHFHYGIKTVAAGEIYEMASVPRWYVPLYLTIKLHLVMLTGALVAVFATLTPKIGAFAERTWRRETTLVVLTAGFPVLCQVVAQAPAYTGLRHFLFVVPAIAVLAGIGLDILLDILAERRHLLAHAAAVVLVGALVWNAGILVQLHPDEYLFYNPLVGGLRGASGQYETDYWVNTLPEAVENLERFLARTDRSFAVSPRPRYTVTTCSQRVQFDERTHPGLQWTSDWPHADFFIAPTHMNCDRALDGRVIGTIERLGVTIAVVKDRRPQTRSTATAAPSESNIR